MKNAHDQNSAAGAYDNVDFIPRAKLANRKLKRGRATLCEVIEALENPSSTGALVFRLTSA